MGLSHTDGNAILASMERDSALCLTHHSTRENHAVLSPKSHFIGELCREFTFLSRLPGRRIRDSVADSWIVDFIRRSHSMKYYCCQMSHLEEPELKASETRTLSLHARKEIRQMSHTVINCEEISDLCSFSLARQNRESSSKPIMVCDPLKPIR